MPLRLNFIDCFSLAGLSFLLLALPLFCWTLVLPLLLEDCDLNLHHWSSFDSTTDWPILQIVCVAFGLGGGLSPLFGNAHLLCDSASNL